MLLNPFTPTEIASEPNEFYGRTEEISVLERSLTKGSVVIQGPMGIGKSSLMARTLLHMEGLGSSLRPRSKRSAASSTTLRPRSKISRPASTEHASNSVILVGNKDIKTLDDAARCLLQEMVTVDEHQNKIKFGFGSFVEFESGEIVRNFRDKHHLSVAMRILKSEYLERVLSERQLLIIAIDEAEKCAVPLAQLVRALVTDTQQHGVKGLRFIVTGVSPFYQQMLSEDQGIARFFYKIIGLEPFQPGEAELLIQEKLRAVLDDARGQGIKLKLDPAVIPRIVAISGGHPHLLQLLGSHLIEHEEQDPDGIIDSRNLFDSLSQICYSDRVATYSTVLHELELYNHLDSLYVLLGLSSESPVNIVNRGFPTRIDREAAQTVVDPTELSWLVANNILRTSEADSYGLVDEFLRVRILLDQGETENERQLIEQKLLTSRGREFEEY